MRRETRSVGQKERMGDRVVINKSSDLIQFDGLLLVLVVVDGEHMPSVVSYTYACLSA